MSSPTVRQGLCVATRRLKLGLTSVLASAAATSGCLDIQNFPPKRGFGVMDSRGRTVNVGRTELVFPEQSDKYEGLTCSYSDLSVDGSGLCLQHPAVFGSGVTENRVLVEAPGFVTAEHVVYPCGRPGDDEALLDICGSGATNIILQDDPSPTAICEAYCAHALECTPDDTEPLDLCTTSCLDGLALSGEADSDACRPLYVAYYDCLSLQSCPDFIAQAEGTAPPDADCSKVEVYITKCEEELQGPGVPGN